MTDAVAVTVSTGDLRIVLDQKVGHSHRRDGHWDADGRPCRECAARGRLMVALGQPCIECGEPIDEGEPTTMRTRYTPKGPIHADLCIWDAP